MTISANLSRTAVDAIAYSILLAASLNPGAVSSVMEVLSASMSAAQSAAPTAFVSCLGTDQSEVRIYKNRGILPVFVKVKKNEASGTISSTVAMSPNLEKQTLACKGWRHP